MNDRKRILMLLNEEFNRWEELLSRLSEDQIVAPQLPAGLSIKDVIAHLMAWQQVSIARLEAARSGEEPVLPGWLAGEDPESEEEIDHFNARIYEAHRHQPWPRVHKDWRDGYLRFMQLAEQIPDEALMDPARYPWLKGYALFAVLQGLYEHHHVDHFEPLLAWLREQEDARDAG